MRTEQGGNQDVGVEDNPDHCSVGCTTDLQPDGTYKPLEPVDTAVIAKTSLYSPELNMFFVSVPHLGGTTAKVLVFKAE